MEYTPVQARGTPEVSVKNVPRLGEPSIVRRLRIQRAREAEHGLLLLISTDTGLPLGIQMNQRMMFGTKTVTAFEYFQQVIEEGDMIDAVVQPSRNGIVPVTLYWIHIQYVGDPSQAGSFSRKDDGLFAMRAKSGEKAERRVAGILTNYANHNFPGISLSSPGFFEIRYAGKKDRKPDMTCSVCGMPFEVKKRNRDRHIRPSHSEQRSFDSENRTDGWHAFVFSDRSVYFFPNELISRRIANSDYVPGRDEYDSWAEMDDLQPLDPPQCTQAFRGSRFSGG